MNNDIFWFASIKFKMINLSYVKYLIHWITAAGTHTHTHTHFPFTVFDCFTLVLTVSHNKSNKQDTKDSQIYIQVPAVGGHSLIMCYFFTYMVITQAHTYNFPNRLVRILTLSTNWSF